MPSAMAPLDTRITRRPPATRRAICSAHSAIAAASSPRPAAVTSDEPTLTTSVLAPLSGLIGRLGSQLLGDRLGEGRAAFAGQRRSGEPRPCPSQLSPHLRGTLPGVVHSVDVIAGQPTQLTQPRRGGV